MSSRSCHRKSQEVTDLVQVELSPNPPANPAACAAHADLLDRHGLAALRPDPRQPL
jgi:hypothetical protein